MGALTCEALGSRLQRGFEDAEESIEVFDAGTSQLNVSQLCRSRASGTCHCRGVTERRIGFVCACELGVQSGTYPLHS